MKNLKINLKTKHTILLYSFNNRAQQTSVYRIMVFNKNINFNIVNSLKIKMCDYFLYMNKNIVINSFLL